MSDIKGYTPLSAEQKAMGNANKEAEERLLRLLESVTATGVADGRWLAIARTHFQEGFMAFNRAIFQPQRIRLPEDGNTTTL